MPALCPLAHILLTLLLGAYILYVRSVRYDRLHAAQRRFHELKAKAKNGQIDPFVAQEIAHTALLYDIPTLSRLGTPIGLLKTYGIVCFSLVVVVVMS